MTWQELRDYIDNLPEKFLDEKVHLYDQGRNRTYIETEFYLDATEDDFTLDVDQPQIWFNMD